MQTKSLWFVFFFSLFPFSRNVCSLWCGMSHTCLTLSEHQDLCIKWKEFQSVAFWCHCFLDACQSILSICLKQLRYSRQECVGAQIVLWRCQVLSVAHDAFKVCRKTNRRSLFTNPSPRLVFWALKSDHWLIPLLQDSPALCVAYSTQLHVHRQTHTCTLSCNAPCESSHAKRVFCVWLYVWVRRCWVRMYLCSEGSISSLGLETNEACTCFQCCIHTLCRPHKYAEHTSRDPHTHTHKQANTNTVPTLFTLCPWAVVTAWKINESWETKRTQWWYLSPSWFMYISPLDQPFLLLSLLFLSSLSISCSGLPEGELTSCMSLSFSLPPSIPRFIPLWPVSRSLSLCTPTRSLFLHSSVLNALPLSTLESERSSLLWRRRRNLD